MKSDYLNWVFGFYAMREAGLAALAQATKKGLPHQERPLFADLDNSFYADVVE